MTTPPTNDAGTKPKPAKSRATADTPVTLAVVVGAHGIGGEVRLKVFADDIAPFTRFNDGALTAKSMRTGTNGTIVRFAEVLDRTAAELLRGTELTVPRGALPPLAEGEYYHADLIGLPVVSTDGEPLGVVAEVANFGAGDVIEIERPDGKRFMVPMRPEAVPDWNDDRLVVDAAFAA
jgi:16S rRNA processing protein RimM